MASITFRSVISAVLLLIVLVSAESKDIRRDVVQESKAKSLIGVSGGTTAVTQAVAVVQANLTLVVSTVTKVTSDVTAQISATVDEVNTALAKVQGGITSLVRVSTTTKNRLLAQLAVVGSLTTQSDDLTTQLNVMATLTAQLTVLQGTLNTQVTALGTVGAAGQAAVFVQIYGTLNLVSGLIVQIEVQLNTIQVTIAGISSQVTLDLTALLTAVSNAQVQATGSVKARADQLLLNLSGSVAAVLTITANANAELDTELFATVNVVNTASASVIVAVTAELAAALNSCICLATVTGR